MKRSEPSKERREELAKKSIYRITCDIPGCTCDSDSKVCQRGFFSLFIQAVNGIDFAQRYHLNYHVDFGNMTYPYSDERMDSLNFWNYYFIQPIKMVPPSDPEAIVNQLHEVNPIRIWHRSYFRKIHEKIIMKLVYTGPVKKHLENQGRQFQNRKTLGVHIRKTDHALEIAPIHLKKFLRTIDTRIKHYDQLYVATDDVEVLDTLTARYGQKVLANEVMRSKGLESVHLSDIYTDRYALGLEVLTDCYCLSRCDKLILVSSNVSFAVLLFNPEVPYILLEQPSAIWKRWKTLIVYLLDRWGIRKW